MSDQHTLLLKAVRNLKTAIMQTSDYQDVNVIDIAGTMAASATFAGATIYGVLRDILGTSSVVSTLSGALAVVGE